MPLYLTDDQNMLRDTARDFMAAEGSIKTQLRHWRDAKCKDGFGHGLWKQFAEMGLPACWCRRRMAGWALAMSRRGSCWRRSGAT
jgi:alkylation response protein AidB-like acyl-CoA dehydrogenase